MQFASSRTPLKPPNCRGLPPPDPDPPLQAILGPLLTGDELDLCLPRKGTLESVGRPGGPGNSPVHASRL